MNNVQIAGWHEKGRGESRDFFFNFFFSLVCDLAWHDMKWNGMEWMKLNVRTYEMKETNEANLN